MRIVILGIGSRGDVQPLVALGVGLQKKGHQVDVVSGDEFEGLVGVAGLGFIPLGVNIQAAMQQYTNMFQFAHSITGLVLQACGTETQAAPQSAEQSAPQPAPQPDAIIATFLGVSACSFARERGIPFFYAVPMPGLSTQDFANPLFPPLKLGKGYNRMTYRISDNMAIKSYPYTQCLFQEPRPTYLFCFSEHVIPRPSDWGDFAHVTGYWSLQTPKNWQPPESLAAFLKAGPPPVCVSFGSMLEKNPEKVTRQVVTALDQAKQRGILISGWGGLRRIDLPAEMIMLDSVPFDWLFPRVAAVVHHGGAGVTAAALRAGIPAVVVPFGLDQPFWGRQVKRLGVGPDPLPLKQLSPGRLAAAIHTVVTDENMRLNALTLGAKLSREDGVGNAVKIIESVVAKKVLNA